MKVTKITKVTAKKSAAKKSAVKKVPRDCYQEITNNIIALIEAGNAKGARLWDNKDAKDAFVPRNQKTGNCYQGINRLILGMVAMLNGYEENAWMTYKQAEAAGWQVRAKEKGVQICKYGVSTKEVEAKDKDSAKTEEERRSYLNIFTVFNVAQIDGYVPEPKADKPLIEINENCDFIKTILAKTDVKMLSEKGDMAFYAPSLDAIQMPPKDCFISEASYYSVLLHELTHSTLHTSRLGRGEAYKNAYPSQRESYAREELVAELGAAFLSSEIGYTQENLEFHASYLEGYLSVLKKDKKAIFKAASDAQKAADFIIENWVEGKAASSEDKVAAAA